ncbi:MAG: DUF3079 domain-containing protein [Lachnospiraceae bacterium]|nr:DUF3079 domain-containing protein [Lachnospiraceae bacterium]MBQ8548988.1 DUF3079 domain-containing protein [Lachnospiraceae bacterium]
MHSRLCKSNDTCCSFNRLQTSPGSSQTQHPLRDCIRK